MQQEKKINGLATSSRKSDFEDLEYTFTDYYGNKLTAGYIRQALQCASDGDPIEQVSLFKGMLDRDPRLVSLLQTRKLAALGCEWSILKSETSEPDKDKQKEFSKFGFYDMLSYLLDSLSFGYAGVFAFWRPGGAGIETFLEIAPENIYYDPRTKKAFIRRISAAPEPVESYPKGQIILHSHKFRPGLPSEGGLLRCLAWLFFYKHYGLQHKVKFIEKFGCPFLIAKIPQAEWEKIEERNKVMAMLKNIGIAGNGVLSETSTLEIHEASSTNAESFLQWFNYLDECYALTILGQLATTTEAGGFSKGQMQENVRQDLLEADCKALISTINTQLIDPLNTYTGSSYVFDMDYSKPDDLTEKAAMVETLSRAGFRAKRKWVEDTFGIPIEEQQQELQQLLQFSEGKIEATAKEEYIQKLTNNTLKGLFRSTETFTEFYKPLQAEISSIFKGIDPESDDVLEKFSERVEKFFKRFPALYDVMDTTTLEKTLQGAILAAMTKGYV